MKNMVDVSVKTRLSNKNVFQTKHKKDVVCEKLIINQPNLSNSKTIEPDILRNVTIKLSFLQELGL